MTTDFWTIARAGRLAALRAVRRQPELPGIDEDPIALRLIEPEPSEDKDRETLESLRASGL
ncbi:MAG: hypothetical protein AAGA28_12175 [Pseudomonadota bacterium]